MTALSNILAGARILAADVRGIAPQTVIKGADQTVTSSTTLQDDDALVVPVVADISYLFFCYLDYEGGTLGSSDLKLQWSVPSGATLRYGAAFANTSGNSTVGTSYTGGTSLAAGTNGSGTLRMVIMVGSLVVSTTAGNCQLEWAQNTSSGTGTIVHAQSFLALWET